jgi:8-oxo-dGTP pyrophosphatase MutT (NUDIX family)
MATPTRPDEAPEERSRNIAPARPASTVIVLRPGDPFEILMLRRNDKVAFMAGSYVFPGGRVDESDRPPGGTRLSAATFPDLSAEDEATYRMAAVRELQEEASVYITVDDLAPFAHWVTPEIETRRFDTRFFLARMPEGQEAMHDNGEMTALEWLSPREAIARFQRRELLLPPPTWTSIRQLAQRSSIDDVMRWARSRKIVRVMPGFIKNEKEFILTLPGDPLLPAIPDWEVPEETRFVLQDGGRWEPLKW